MLCSVCLGRDGKRLGADENAALFNTLRNDALFDAVRDNRPRVVAQLAADPNLDFRFWPMAAVQDS